MSRCFDRINFNKRFFHSWREWENPIQATYRGVLTLVQIRECLYCHKRQVKEL